MGEVKAFLFFLRANSILPIPEEVVETLHYILLAEYEYLAGCDVQWLEP